MKRPWFKFYPSDFLNGTRGLSLEERGAYMTLLALMYDEQGAIPDDERWVCGALDCDVRVWRRLRDKLCRYGKIVPNADGFLANRRVLEEVRSAELLAEVRRKSGRSGGQQSGISRAISKENKPPDEANASNALLYARASSKSDSLSSEAKASSESPLSLVASPRSDDVREAVEAWNETASRQGWAKVAKVTPARRQTVAARIREHGLETWKAMLERTTRLDWVNDPNRRSAGHRNWQPHIDWFAKSATFLKLLEGAYGGDVPLDWDKALRIWRVSEGKGWDRDLYGPAPNEPGYRGPSTETDLFATGARP